MKAYMIIILGLAINILASCTSKGSAAEENTYNPYDTSELEGKSSDTLYSLDSSVKVTRLRELE